MIFDRFESNEILTVPVVGAVKVSLPKITVSTEEKVISGFWVTKATFRVLPPPLASMVFVTISSPAVVVGEKTKSVACPPPGAVSILATNCMPSIFSEARLARKSIFTLPPGVMADDPGDKVMVVVPVWFAAFLRISCWRLTIYKATSKPPIEIKTKRSSVIFLRVKCNLLFIFINILQFRQNPSPLMNSLQYPQYHPRLCLTIEL